MILTGLALIGLTVSAIFLFMQFNAFGKGALERGLSFAFNAPTSIGSVTCAPAQGVVELHDLCVSNPKGFKEVPAIAFQTVRIEFDYRTLLTETPTIRKVLLKNGKIDLRYDLGSGEQPRPDHQAKSPRLSKDKLQIETATPAPSKETPKNAAQSEKPDSNEAVPAGAGSVLRRRFIIQEFRCEGATISVASNLLPTMSATVDVPPFSLAGLGEGKGMTAADGDIAFPAQRDQACGFGFEPARSPSRIRSAASSWNPPKRRPRNKPPPSLGAQRRIQRHRR